MYLLEIDMLSRIIIGITAMVLLFGSFMIAFISSQRRKLENQRNEKAFLEEKQEILKEQNRMLEQKVQERTTELELQKTALQKSLSELKATQQQLVHREKMASLGELMAGIAHEIQNPLNFINNFSEVTVEMFEDLFHEQEAGNETGVKDLQEEILNNLQKINLHGKRAASIVKGMLQHSRINSGKKEPTNINELTEECVQLTFQGTKAKDKSFQFKLNQDYQDDIPMIMAVPQDIGRVIINLVSNAIYSVKEKKLQSGEEYEPEVTISTLLNSNHVNIKIKDNGKGIAPKVADKIFQPFFTTKPSGQGTGLGLSLSYEIVKQPNVEILINTKEEI
jgi:C4-dicarboxylate-specific signal transduction histidine kinase